MSATMKSNEKIRRRQRRAVRVKAKIFNPENIQPKVVVFKSNRYTFAQIFDPVSNKIVASASDITQKGKGTKIEKAVKVGEELAKKAKSLKITSVVFDRNGYKYHGRVKAIADGMRENGIKL